MNKSRSQMYCLKEMTFYKGHSTSNTKWTTATKCCWPLNHWRNSCPGGLVLGPVVQRALHPSSHCCAPGHVIPKRKWQWRQEVQEEDLTGENISPSPQNVMKTLSWPCVGEGSEPQERLLAGVLDIKIHLHWQSNLSSSISSWETNQGYSCAHGMLICETNSLQPQEGG